jgi:hypothetical protein
MELRSNSRIPVRWRSLVPIAVSVLLCASSQIGFSQGPADSKDPEDRRDDESWATEMESLVWAALAEARISFGSVLAVECAYPTCEIAYSATGRSKVARVIDLIGKDHRGLPIVKYFSSGRRELSPGYKITEITFSTESAEFEAQVQKLCQRELEANRPVPGGTCEP